VFYWGLRNAWKSKGIFTFGVNLKIKEKIDELKLKTNEISIDRRIIKEIKQYELKQSEESSQKFIEEFEEINQISEFEERVRKKVRLYGKIE